MINSNPAGSQPRNFSKYRVLSGSALKTIALVTMIIDHVGLYLLSKASFADVPLFSIGSISVTVYWICRKIGRIAFPVYVFLLSEGFIHTHDKIKYGRNLLLFALISEIPWNLVHSGKVLLPSSQNVFFTLFLGFLALYFCELYREQGNIKHLACLIVVFAVSYFLKADYGIRGVGFILLVHLLRNIKPAQALIGSSIFTNNAPAVFISFILINLYNGKRGYITSKAGKYIFYALYPLHILVLWYIRKKLWGW